MLLRLLVAHGRSVGTGPRPASPATLTAMEIRGPRLMLRPVVPADAERLAEILATPDVARWWPAYDRARVEAEYLVEEPDVTVFAIDLDGRVVGLI